MFETICGSRAQGPNVSHLHHFWTVRGQELAVRHIDPQTAPSATEVVEDQEVIYVTTMLQVFQAEELKSGHSVRRIYPAGRHVSRRVRASFGQLRAGLGRLRTGL